MREQELIRVIEEETGISGVTLDTAMDALELESIDFLDLMLKCGVPREAEMGIHTVGDIAKAVCAG